MCAEIIYDFCLIRLDSGKKVYVAYKPQKVVNPMLKMQMKLSKLLTNRNFAEVKKTLQNSNNLYLMHM